MRNYGSYLVRHWLLGEAGESRHVLDLQHIQTGRRTRVSTFVEAQAWLESLSRENHLVQQRYPDRDCLEREVLPSTGFDEG